MYKLELSEQIVMTIVQILRAAPIPYNVSAPILAELEKQINEQHPSQPTP